VRDYSAFSAGLAFLPVGAVFLVISVFLSARLVNRFGVKPIIISGMALQIHRSMNIKNNVYSLEM
jgi:hypothetical protein